MDTNQLPRLTDAEKKLDLIEVKDEPAEVITLSVCYTRTVIEDETGERREVELPASYDENVPFQDWGGGEWCVSDNPISEGKADPSRD